MDIVKLLFHRNSAALILIMLFSQMVSAEVSQFKELPKESEIQPPPKPAGDGALGVRIRKSSQMRFPGAEKSVSRAKKQMQQLGYVEVDDDSIQHLSIDIMKDKFMPIEDVENNVSSPLSAITNMTGIFKTMELVGCVANSPAKDTAKWLRVTRYFTLANGNILMLSEYDFKTARVITTFPEELVNENINGSPAMLLVKKTPRGKVFSELRWSTKNKLYSLNLEGHAQGVGPKNELVDLATGIKEVTP